MRGAESFYSPSGGAGQPRRLVNGRFGSKEAAGAAPWPGRRALRCPVPLLPRLKYPRVIVLSLIEVINLAEAARVALVLLSYISHRQTLSLYSGRCAVGSRRFSAYSVRSWQAGPAACAPTPACSCLPSSSSSSWRWAAAGVVTCWKWIRGPRG